MQDWETTQAQRRELTRALEERKADFDHQGEKFRKRVDKIYELVEEVGVERTCSRNSVTSPTPRTIDLSEFENRGEYDPHMLHRNLVFGTPDEVITKLRAYEEFGVDHFTYYASLGLGMKEQKRSMELFVQEVMPAFA